MSAPTISWPRLRPQSSAVALDIAALDGSAAIRRLLASENPQVGSDHPVGADPDAAAQALAGLTKLLQADLVCRAARLDLGSGAMRSTDLEAILVAAYWHER